MIFFFMRAFSLPALLIKILSFTGLACKGGNVGIFFVFFMRCFYSGHAIFFILQCSYSGTALFIFYGILIQAPSLFIFSL